MTQPKLNIYSTAKYIKMNKECPYEFFVRQYFGIDESVTETTEVKTDFGQLVGMLCMFDEKHKNKTPMEQRILDIITTDSKEKSATEIAEAYNKITGKNYSRKDMSSLLAKMAKKNLIICRKESDSVVAKHLWSPLIAK